VFAILGIGLHCRDTYTRTGGSQPELSTARNWIELAAAALSYSDFLEHPTIDSTAHNYSDPSPTTRADYVTSFAAVRALSLLAIFHLSIGPGDEGTLGFALTSQAVQAGLQVSRLFSLSPLNSSSETSFLPQINLHRDPSQLKTLFSFREAEERRSLIHHVYLLDGICTASYSRGCVHLLYF